MRRCKALPAPNWCTQPHARRGAERARQPGLVTTGSLLALNSYENRVFQVGCRSAGWSLRLIVASSIGRAGGPTRQILEEHAFTGRTRGSRGDGCAAVAAARPDAESVRGIPVRRLPASGRTGPAARRSAVLSGSAGSWVDCMPVGRMPRVRVAAPRSYIASFWPRAGDYLMRMTGCHPSCAMSMPGVSQQALARLLRLRPCRRCRGDPTPMANVHEGNVLWYDGLTDGGPQLRRLRRCPFRPAVQDLWMLLGADRRQRPQRLSDCSPVTRFQRFRPAANYTCRGVAHLCLTITPRGSRDAGRTLRSRSLPWFNPRATGRIASSSCASRSPRCRSRRWWSDSRQR